MSCSHSVESPVWIVVSSTSEIYGAISQKGVIEYRKEGLFGAEEVTFSMAGQGCQVRLIRVCTQRYPNRGKGMFVLPLQVLLNPRECYLVRNEGFNTV